MTTREILGTLLYKLFRAIGWVAFAITVLALLALAANAVFTMIRSFP